MNKYSISDSDQTIYYVGEEYCRVVAEVCFETYQIIYPRFSMIADQPGASQRFLHAANAISIDSPELCFQSQLIDRVLLHGVGRCNLHKQLVTGDPVLRSDIDKIIQLNESTDERPHVD